MYLNWVVMGAYYFPIVIFLRLELRRPIHDGYMSIQIGYGDCRLLPSPARPIPSTFNMQGPLQSYHVTTA